MFEILFVVSVAFLVVAIFLYRNLQKQLSLLKSDKQSILTRFGKTTEQFIPFLKDYPYDKEKFRFLGTPVDGIQFERDKLVFIEFKTGESKLSEIQENVKELVEKKKVEFKEIRV